MKLGDRLDRYEKVRRVERRVRNPDFVDQAVEKGGSELFADGDLVGRENGGVRREGHCHRSDAAVRQVAEIEVRRPVGERDGDEVVFACGERIPW